MERQESAGISTELVSVAASACLDTARAVLRRYHQGEVSDYEVQSFLCLVGTEMSARMIFEVKGGTDDAAQAVEITNDRLRMCVRALQEINADG